MAAAPQEPGPAYLYSDRYQAFDYGPNHPLRMQRLAMAHELIGLCGLNTGIFPFQAASREQLCAFHDRHYLDTLSRLSEDPDADGGVILFGLGAGDNPVFPGLYEWSSLLAGATLEAARLVAEDGRPRAFNPAGGMHHALVGRASGFCYVNDPALAARWLAKRGKRVAYVDLDAHHGDGVQWAFYNTDQVLTISLHQHPATLFPGTGYVAEMGKDRGRGYSVNLPLWPDTEDEIYCMVFEEVVPPILEAFRPDYVITQLGVDALMADPLANLNLTTAGYGRCLRTIRSLAGDRWIATGGGGYNVLNVARAWTLAWAIMTGREDQVPAVMPEEYCERLRIPQDSRQLLDDIESIQGRFWARSARDAEDAVAFIKKHHFPILGARG